MPMPRIAAALGLIAATLFVPSALPAQSSTRPVQREAAISPVNPASWTQTPAGWLHRPSQLLCPQRVGQTLRLASILEEGVRLDHPMQAQPHCHYVGTSDPAIDLSILVPMSDVIPERITLVEPLSEEQMRNWTPSPPRRGVSEISIGSVSWSDRTWRFEFHSFYREGDEAADLWIEPQFFVPVLSARSSRSGDTQRGWCSNCGTLRIYGTAPVNQLELLHAGASAITAAQTPWAQHQHQCEVQIQSASALPRRTLQAGSSAPAGQPIAQRARRILASRDATCFVGEIHVFFSSQDSDWKVVEVTTVGSSAVRLVSPSSDPDADDRTFVLLPVRESELAGQWLLVQARRGVVTVRAIFTGQPSLLQAASQVEAAVLADRRRR